MKKVGKIIRPFRYDLDQIPYDYTMEVRNRFKELELVDRVSGELWMEVCNTVQEAVTKIIPKKKNARRQSGCLRKSYKWKRSKRQGGKEKMYPTESIVLENSKQD